ncbi:MAG: hypothetical protein HQ564_09280 [Candidatus Saganbacteria bacterium]|nr:hypothetical protein [Candidatus Saganbacteria bacterium]
MIELKLISFDALHHAVQGQATEDFEKIDLSKVESILSRLEGIENSSQPAFASIANDLRELGLPIAAPLIGRFFDKGKLLELIDFYFKEGEDLKLGVMFRNLPETPNGKIDWKNVPPHIQNELMDVFSQLSSRGDMAELYLSYCRRNGPFDQSVFDYKFGGLNFGAGGGERRLVDLVKDSKYFSKVRNFEELAKTCLKYVPIIKNVEEVVLSILIGTGITTLGLIFISAGAAFVGLGLSLISLSLMVIFRIIRKRQVLKEFYSIVRNITTVNNIGEAKTDLIAYLVRGDIKRSGPIAKEVSKIFEMEI